MEMRTKDIVASISQVAEEDVSDNVEGLERFKQASVLMSLANLSLVLAMRLPATGNPEPLVELKSQLLERARKIVGNQ